MRWQWIDREGELIDRLDRQLAQDLSASLSAQKITDYLVINLGFAAIRLVGRAAQIRVRPRSITDAALAGLLAWMSDQSCERYMVSSFVNGQWTYTIVRAADAAARRTILTQYRNSNRPHRPSIAHRSRTIESLPVNCPLRTAYLYWREQGGVDDRTLLEWIKEGPIKRYALITRPWPDQKFLISQYGSGLPSCAKSWLRGATQQSLEDQPDRDYAVYCERTYANALQHQKPVVEDVDAVVMWPGYGPTRRRYRRLILPFHDNGGRVQLLGASIHDPSIDLLSSPGHVVG